MFHGDTRSVRDFLLRPCGQSGAGRLVVLLFILALVALAVIGLRFYQTERSTVAPAPGPSPAPPSASSTDQSAETRVATDRSFSEASGRVLPEIPEIPSYPGATLIGSARQARAAEPAEGYRIKWTTSDNVEAVMQWYAKSLPAAGWKYQTPEDAGSPVEQLARIQKDYMDGYVAAEATGGVTEIIVSLQDTRRATRRGQR